MADDEFVETVRTRIADHDLPSPATPTPWTPRPTPSETAEDIVAFYARARAASDKVIDELEIDSLGTAWHGESVSLRWTLIHMIEETARHVGHMDIVRELLDGNGRPPTGLIARHPARGKPRETGPAASACDAGAAGTRSRRRPTARPPPAQRLMRRTARPSPSGSEHDRLDQS
ncbi:DUF664 domain-containing protein [Streptomyces carpinensis]|uniref:DUF664 domain-containing protein n=1 Tax=Streptomyces carpinensis TaxID=66369 RepID=A0ABV1W326_9ACTN